MAVFKCKMCGGNLEFTDGQSYGTCDSCGSTMTLPKADDERIVNLFNRATHYRQQNEFDKAIATYESILAEDTRNAEAYWGLVLSKYGIEYVEDPKTHKRIPTCHRVQHESILADLNYKSALEYAIDYSAEKLYQEEAIKIAEIQKNILSVANKEEAYDIFICYKETDNSGQRTKDSVIAQDIYTQLTNEGYKVFFAKITLEDRLGQEYEPYIFAALNSAKIMLVVGTDKDNFNAVWVKNEWSRFLAIIKEDKSKILIPCYRDMDAYDLPEELSMFQSQDMNKIGFIQDLVRGIKKVIGGDKSASKANIVQNIAPDYAKEAGSLLKRAFLLLEEGQWGKANEALEKVLNIEPENPKAYLGLLMAELKVNKEENLNNRKAVLSNNTYFQKAVRFADDSLRAKLEQYDKNIKDSLEQQKEELLGKYKIEKAKEDVFAKKYNNKEKRKRKHVFILLGSGLVIWLLLYLILSICDRYGYAPVMALCIGAMCYVFLIFLSLMYLGSNSKDKEHIQQSNITSKIKCELYLIDTGLSGRCLSMEEAKRELKLSQNREYLEQKKQMIDHIRKTPVPKLIAELFNNLKK